LTIPNPIDGKYKVQRLFEWAEYLRAKIELSRLDTWTRLFAQLEAAPGLRNKTSSWARLIKRE